MFSHPHFFVRPVKRIWRQRYHRWVYHRKGPLKGKKWYKKRVWKYVVEEYPPVVVVEKAYYCFIKGFFTEKGHKERAPWVRWVETSVEVWAEFVINIKDQDQIPGDEEMVELIEKWLAEDDSSLWVLSLRDVGHEWAKEGPERIDREVVTWPVVHCTVWAYDYDRKVREGEFRV